MNGVQIAVALGILALIALATWAKVRTTRHDGSERDVYLAGGGLSWLYVAGAITLTNLSTDQLVGMNGNQMLLLAWWEISGFFGLLILAFVFVPIYYRNGCTTVTQLLERRYAGETAEVRLLISALFLFGNVLIYVPAGLYSGALFLNALFGGGIPLIALAAFLAAVSAAYTILGGLRAVAVMDTYSGFGVLGVALLIVLLALSAIGWDLSGVPAERLTFIGDANSPIPFHTLFTGMVFIQIYYWSTNQNITQKAMIAPNVREAQKGVLAAAVVRILIIPVIVTLPGVVAYKLLGPVGDKAYGLLVARILPAWLAGAFAAMIAAAVIAHTAAILNATVALYAVDFHPRIVGEVRDQWRLSGVATLVVTAIALVLVPVYAGANSIINLLQQLNGLSSMPILSAFIVGLVFRGVSGRAAMVGVIWGVLLYALFQFVLAPGGWVTLHYIDFMVVVLASSVAAALIANRIGGGERGIDAGIFT
ncbi:MAG: SLC5 family protein [Sphingomonas sp.]|uniref:sodium:solute symporter family transporter n=1 Tax=Sphingomonas sp. TaxID=28214 RepID=UPI0025ECB627|nr:SLC5 family protein [Sphingomonas sp.]MBX9882386.1 SLC5 family protein [Sphingomonas sp.]